MGSASTRWYYTRVVLTPRRPPSALPLWRRIVASRSPLWWIAAGMFAGVAALAWVTLGWFLGIGVSLAIGGAALASYWRVRN